MANLKKKNLRMIANLNQINGNAIIVLFYQFYEKFSKIFWHPILRDTLYNGYLQCARLIVLDVDSC